LLSTTIKRERKRYGKECANTIGQTTWY